MCGRFVLSRRRALGTIPVNWRELYSLLAGYNITPSQHVFVVVPSASGGLIPVKATWGISNVYRGGLTINARSETVAEKPMFREAFRRRRCLVPADGWYEWASAGSHKQPYFITPKSGELMMMAGLFQPGPAGVPSMVVLTKPATAELALIHDRMPLIIPGRSWGRWLADDTTAPELDALIRSQEMAFEARPVSKRVGSPGNDDSGLIAPITPPKAEPGLFG